MKAVAMLGVAVVLGTVGCASHKKAATAPSPELTPSYVEAPITDVAPLPPVMASATPAMGSSASARSYDPASVTSVMDTATPALAASSYTVQKGDTLYGIARRAYGDGKQWKQIAAANPGVSPQSLKVGQRLNLP